MAGQIEKVKATIAPAVADLGFDLEDVGLSAAGRRSVVRVIVDADDGVDLDAVAEISRAVGKALDQSDVMGDGAYVLEVTSPGVDRPLTDARHWRRATGHLVKTAVGGHEVTARVTAATESAVTLEIDGKDRQFGYGELGPAIVQIEFNRPRRGGDPA